MTSYIYLVYKSLKEFSIVCVGESGTPAVFEGRYITNLGDRFEIVCHHDDGGIKILAENPESSREGWRKLFFPRTLNGEVLRSDAQIATFLFARFGDGPFLKLQGGSLSGDIIVEGACVARTPALAVYGIPGVEMRLNVDCSSHLPWVGKFLPRRFKERSRMIGTRFVAGDVTDHQVSMAELAVVIISGLIIIPELDRGSQDPGS